MAVANSRESLPFPSRVRTKTGIASCNRAHLRSSFLITYEARSEPTIKEVISSPNSRISGAKPRNGRQRVWIPVANRAPNTEITGSKLQSSGIP